MPLKKISLENFTVFNKMGIELCDGINVFIGNNGHKQEWLSPIRDALIRKMKRQIKTWRLELAVLNHEMAFTYGILAG